MPTMIRRMTEMALLNPKQARFVRKVRGTSLPEAALAYYKSRQGGYTLQRKRGTTSQKDPVARRLNLYQQSNVGGGRYITHIYAQRSRVLRGTENLLAVRLNTGEKGWVTAQGRFMGEDDIRKMLYSVDRTLAGMSEESALLGLYDSLSASEKAKVADALQDYDWEVFWKEMYTEKGVRNIDNQYANYDELVETIAQALGR